MSKCFQALGLGVVLLCQPFLVQGEEPNAPVQGKKGPTVYPWVMNFSDLSQQTPSSYAPAASGASPGVACPVASSAVSEGSSASCGLASMAHVSRCAAWPSSISIATCFLNSLS